MESDRRALSQIIINLTNNAIKFTDKGTVRLEVAHYLPKGQASTEIRVVDTGAGIRPEDKAKLSLVWPAAALFNSSHDTETVLRLAFASASIGRWASVCDGSVLPRARLPSGQEALVVLES